jgi:hypothetical protein
MAPSTALEADLFCWSILSRQALTLLTSYDHAYSKEVRS